MTASGNDSALDLLVVEAFTWTPTLETACEIGLRHVNAGRRVGFVFLDIENVDQFPLDVGIDMGSRLYRLGRKARMRRVKTVEEILRSRGVTVIDPVRYPRSGRRLSCAQLGVDSTDSLRTFRCEGAAIGLGTLASLVRRLGDSEPDFTENRPAVDRLLNSAYRAFVLTRDLIEQWRPSEVLVYNGRFAVSKGISEAARLADVRVFYHELVSTHDRFYFSHHSVHSMHHSRRELLDSWDAAGEDRELVARQYFTPGRGGVPLFETQFLEFQRREQTIPRNHRWRIAYFVSSIEEYAAVEEGFEDPLFDTQHSAAEWLVSWVHDNPDVELIIRLHPRMRHLSVRERGWWDSLSAPNVTVLQAESPIDSYRLASSADRVVAYHSSIGAEASYLGAVSVLIGDADYRGLDCVYEPRTTGELAALLRDTGLAPKPRENCLPFGYQRLRRGEQYEFYQPISFDEGSFFGQRITPDKQDPPLLHRIARGALRRLDRRSVAARKEVGR